MSLSQLVYLRLQKDITLEVTPHSNRGRSSNPAITQTDLTIDKGKGQNCNQVAVLDHHTSSGAILVPVQQPQWNDLWKKSYTVANGMTLDSWPSRDI